MRLWADFFSVRVRQWCNNQQLATVASRRQTKQCSLQLIRKVARALSFRTVRGVQLPARKKWRKNVRSEMQEGEPSSGDETLLANLRLSRVPAPCAEGLGGLLHSATKSRAKTVQATLEVQSTYAILARLPFSYLSAILRAFLDTRIYEARTCHLKGRGPARRRVNTELVLEASYSTRAKLESRPGCQPHVGPIGIHPCESGHLLRCCAGLLASDCILAFSTSIGTSLLPE